MAHRQCPLVVLGLPKHVGSPHLSHVSQMGYSRRSAAGCTSDHHWTLARITDALLCAVCDGPQSRTVLASGECTGSSWPPIRGTTWEIVNFYHSCH